MRVEIYAGNTEAETKSIKDNAKINLSRLGTFDVQLVQTSAYLI